MSCIAPYVPYDACDALGGIEFRQTPGEPCPDHRALFCHRLAAAKLGINLQFADPDRKG
jgi:hypothetical protein